MSSSSRPRSESRTAIATEGHTVRIDGTDRVFTARPGESILAEGRRSGVWLPFECGWGSCGVCKVTVVDGEVESLFPDAPAVDARDARRRRSIVCQTAAGSDLTLKANRLGPFAERPTADYEAELVGVEELAAGIASFRFALDRPADYRPGQYSILELAPGLRRCYSMAGSPGETEVRFVAKHYAPRPGSTALFGTAVGTRIQMALPFGDMWWRGGAARSILVAGGTGISPILSLLRQIASEPEVHPTEVVYGAGAPAELVCRDELEALVADMPDARLHLVVARADDRWSGHVGTVVDVLPDIVREGDRHYLAGPPPMVNAVLGALAERNTPIHLIHYDRFG